MMNDLEWAMRQLAVALQYLIDVADNDVLAFEQLPDSLHHAAVDLFQEIAAVDWERLGR